MLRQRTTFGPVVHMYQRDALRSVNVGPDDFYLYQAAKQNHLLIFCPEHLHFIPIFATFFDADSLLCIDKGTCHHRTSAVFNRSTSDREDEERKCIFSE